MLKMQGPVYPNLNEAEMTPLPPPPAGFIQPVPHVGGIQQPQVVVISAPSFGSHKAQVTCSNCGNNVQSKTEKHPSVVAWISSVALCCLGCWLGCCLVPLCVDSCMDTEHTCPSCGAVLGTHRAF